jgi:sulfide dehydrogenase cytochrome subunit
MNILRPGLLVVPFVMLFVPAPLPAEETPPLIGVCVVCHGEDGAGVGYEDVPIIAGIPATHIEEALYAYQDRARQCVKEPEMCESVDQLTEDQIAEAADYYAAKKRVASGEPYNDYLATAGKQLHERHCARCHVEPDDEDVENALGIPLHGQKSAYLRYALQAYRNGERLTLIPQMAEKLALIDDDSVEALINYYASYEPEP